MRVAKRLLYVCPVAVLGMILHALRANFLRMYVTWVFHASSALATRIDAVTVVLPHCDCAVNVQQPPHCSLLLFYLPMLVPVVTGVQQSLEQWTPAHPCCSGCREMLPRAKEQPPDPPDAPAGAGAAAPGAAGAPAAASASAMAGLPQGFLPDAHSGGASARPHVDREDTHAPAADDSAGRGGFGVGPGPEPGSGIRPAHGATAGAERPGGERAAGSGSVPGPGSAGGAAPAEESFRRIQLEATAPGAGLAGEERGLFYGGALTRAKRDTGGVGAPQAPFSPGGMA